MLYIAYAIHGVNSYPFNGEIESYNITFYSGDDGCVVDQKERWGMNVHTI
jgi:hypothetical protein